MERQWEELSTGKSGDPELERAWLRKAKEMFNIFCAKQQSYGPNNIALTREKGVTVRMNDKMQRLLNLHLNDAENPILDETLRDTVIDLGDYAIIWLLCADGDWPEYEEYHGPEETETKPDYSNVEHFALGAACGVMGALLAIVLGGLLGG